MKQGKYHVTLTHKDGGQKTLIADGDPFEWTKTTFKLYVQKMCKVFPNAYTFCTWPPEPWEPEVILPWE